jgi:Fe-S cluster assembly iron-binding protein IscA
MGLALDEPRTEEVPVNSGGINFLIEERLKPFVEGSTVDYIKDQYREGFVIESGSSC